MAFFKKKEETKEEVKQEVQEEKPKKKAKKKDWFDKEGKKLVEKDVGIKKFVTLAMKAYGHEGEYSKVVSALELQDAIRSRDYRAICDKLKIK